MAVRVPSARSVRPEQEDLSGDSIMNKLVGFIGATIGSYAGWALGVRFGMMTAFMLSILGTGLGIYAGRRVVQDMLE
jgi:uncharacterized membrane protein YeaQ/YmgE (transglycosylase-associated protein family)